MEGGLGSNADVEIYSPMTTPVEIITAELEVAEHSLQEGIVAVTTPSSVLEIGAAGGSITVRGVNACGNSNTRSLTLTVVNCARMAMDEGTEGATENSELTVEAFPNPFDGNLNIRIEGISASTLQAEVFDLSGRSVYQSVISNSPVVSFNPPIEAGVYMLRISDGSNVQQSIRIVKVN